MKKILYTSIVLVLGYFIFTLTSYQRITEFNAMQFQSFDIDGEELVLLLDVQRDGEKTFTVIIPTEDNYNILVAEGNYKASSGNNFVLYGDNAGSFESFKVLNNQLTLSVMINGQRHEFTKGVY